MALNFPTNPTIGQEFTGGGKTWAWTGAAWEAVASAAGVTGQGGEFVLSKFKNGNAVISASELPSGSYYVTTQGSGSVYISSYKSNIIDLTLLQASVTGESTNYFTIPSDSQGVYLSGSYKGSLVFQVIPSAIAATISSTTIAFDSAILDWSTFVPVPNTTKLVDIASSVTTTYDTSSDTVTVGSIGTKDPAGNYFFTQGVSLFASNGTTTVLSGGYNGNSESSIFSTTDFINWQRSYNINNSDYGYNDIVTYVGSLFIQGSSYTGTSSTTNRYRTSPDGVNWTERTLPISINWLPPEYINGLYVFMPGAGMAGGLPNANTVYYTSPDAVTWTLRAYPVSSIKTGMAVYGGTLFAMDTSGNCYSTTDGLNWAAYYSSSAGYVGLNGGNSLLSARTGVVLDTSEDRHGAYIPVYYYNNSGITGVMRCRPGQAVTVLTYTTAPFNTGTSEAGTIVRQIDGKFAIKKLQSLSPFYNNSLTKVSRYISPYNNGQNGQAIFYSRLFKRWYLDDGNKIGYSDIGSDSKYNKSSINITAGTTSNFIEFDGKYLAFTNGSNFYRTSDGVNWSLVSTATFAGDFTSLAAYNGIIVSKSTQAAYFEVSFDGGVSWSKAAHGDSSCYAVRGTSGGFIGSFFYGSNSAADRTSLDGSTWTRTNGSAYSYTGGIESRYSGDLYFCRNSSSGTTAGAVAKMPWSVTPVNYPTANQATINKAGELYVYCDRTSSSSSTNVFYTSPNGITWTQRTIPLSRGWTMVGGSDTKALLFGYNSSSSVSAVVKYSITSTLSIG